MYNPLMTFAGQILIGIFILLIIMIIVRVAFPCKATQEIWNFASNVLPPLITLIIGYFFGKQ